MGRLANFDPEVLCSTAAWRIYGPDYIRIRPARQLRRAGARQGFRATHSTLVDNPVQLHPEPRIGLAWRPSLSRDIVVRTGYGLYANRVSFFGSSVDLAFNPPFQSRGTSSAPPMQRRACNIRFPYCRCPRPFLTSLRFRVRHTPGIARPFSPSRPIGTSRTQRPSTTVWRFSSNTKTLYSHSRTQAPEALNLAVSRSNNQPALASPTNPVNGLTTNSVANAVERVPFLGIAPLVFAVESIGTSRYDSLQATLNKRLSHGFQFLAAYTLSRSVDSAQDSLGSAAFGVYGATVFGEQVFNDQNDVAAQRGPSDFDRRHRFVVSYIWQLPEPAGDHRHLLSKLAEGWAALGSRDAPIRAAVQYSRQCRRHTLRPGHLLHDRKSGVGDRHWKMQFCRAV